MNRIVMTLKEEWRQGTMHS